MFTIEQIKQAHSQVKSGADFPAYIKQIAQLGVTGYETYVTDGHTVYYGAGSYTIASPAKYTPIAIAANSNSDVFKADLKAHQQGHSDYPTFCNQCASSGVEKWVVDIQQLTCTYYDIAGNQMLQEAIPA